MNQKQASPHTIRAYRDTFRLLLQFTRRRLAKPTAAMELLQAGVDRAVIALWLGHESVETTQIYLDANLALKEKILAKITTPEGKPGRYKADDELLAFLQHL
jgi:integrase